MAKKFAIFADCSMGTFHGGMECDVHPGQPLTGKMILGSGTASGTAPYTFSLTLSVEDDSNTRQASLTVQSTINGQTPDGQYSSGPLVFNTNTPEMTINSPEPLQPGKKGENPYLMISYVITSIAGKQGNFKKSA